MFFVFLAGAVTGIARLVRQALEGGGERSKKCGVLSLRESKKTRAKELRAEEFENKKFLCPKFLCPPPSGLAVVCSPIFLECTVNLKDAFGPSRASSV